MGPDLPRDATCGFECNASALAGGHARRSRIQRGARLDGGRLASQAQSCRLPPEPRRSAALRRRRGRRARRFDAAATRRGERPRVCGRSRLVCGTGAALRKPRSRPRGSPLPPLPLCGVLPQTARVMLTGRVAAARVGTPRRAPCEKRAVDRSRVLRWPRELGEAGDQRPDGRH